VLVVPVALLVGYGLLRLSTSLFTELRELVFAKATQGATRTIALQTFEHLHALSLRFHLERQTGGMTRDIERGVRGIESLISYSLYSIVPTLLELALVLGILAVKFDVWFAGITLIALACTSCSRSASPSGAPSSGARPTSSIRPPTPAPSTRC
jgi:ABC-type bacteriocin/lantibiotic exporter with double-glycine peptidase domain